MSDSSVIRQRILGFENKFESNILDPLHGQIGLTNVESQIVKTDAFERLKSIQQLGFVSNIYPGATHKRFEHSIGTQYVTWTMLKKFLVNYSLQEKWADKKIYAYFTDNILQNVRLSGLLHDIGHGPFSHTFEQVSKSLGEKIDHDELTSYLLTYDFSDEEKCQIIKSEKERKRIEETEKLAQFIKELSIIEKKDRQIIAGIFNKDFTFNNEPNGFTCIRLFLHDILKGDVGSDRIDYLLRDTYFSGLGHRFNFSDLLSNLKGIYDDKTNRLLLAIDYEGRSILEFIMMTRYYHYRLIAHHPSNCLEETKFEQRVKQFVKQPTFSFYSTAADTDTIERILPPQKEDLKIAGIWNLGSIGVDHFRFFFYRIAGDNKLNEIYRKKVINYILNNVKIFEKWEIKKTIYVKFELENPHLPIIEAYRPDYQAKKEEYNEKYSVLLHDYSNLLQGLGRTYVEDSSLIVFTSLEDKDKVSDYTRSTHHFFTNQDLFIDMMSTVEDLKANRLDFLLFALYKILNPLYPKYLSGIKYLYKRIEDLQKQYNVKYYDFSTKDFCDPIKGSFGYPTVIGKEIHLIDDLLILDACGLIEIKMHSGQKKPKNEEPYFSQTYYLRLIKRGTEETGKPFVVVPIESALRVYSDKFLRNIGLQDLRSLW